MAVSLGYFLVILDATAVNLALPALRQDLGGGITGLQWVVDGYTLAFAALLLSAGVAGDRFGPRRVFLTGLVLFTAASAGCALAPSIGDPGPHPAHPGCGRGAAGAQLTALLQASYPDRTERARAVGLWGGIGGLAAASGPVLGGALTAAASWRLVFAINIPVGLLAWWLTRRRVASTPGQRDRRGDPIGQITAIVALTALIAGLIEAGPHGWASWPVAAGPGHRGRGPPSRSWPRSAGSAPPCCRCRCCGGRRCRGAAPWDSSSTWASTASCSRTACTSSRSGGTPR